MLQIFISQVLVVVFLQFSEYYNNLSQTCGKYYYLSSCICAMVCLFKATKIIYLYDNKKLLIKH